MMQERKMFLKVLLSVCLFMVGAGGALADEVTFTAGVDTGTNSVTKDGVTVTTSDMLGNNYYVCSSLNTINTVSIQSSNDITKVVLTFTASGTNTYGPTSLIAKGYVARTPNSNQGTWTGNSKSVTLTANSTTAHLTSIVVTYDAVTVPVTITTAKYATFCNAMATDFSSTGITVYKVKASGGVARLTEVSGGIVPAGEGVVLYKDVTEAETIAVPMTTTTASLSDNEMVGVTERTLVTKTGTGGKYNYILQSGEGGSIVFNMAIEDGAYMPEGRAYLSTADGVASRLSVLFCDEAGIADRRAETAGRHDAIDLYGRKWGSGSLPRGLYIIDGKKTIVK